MEPARIGDDYRGERKLASGGFGTVDLATQLSLELGALAEDATAWHVAGGVAAAGAVGALLMVIVSEAAQGCTRFASDGSCRVGDVFDGESGASWAALSGAFAVASAVGFIVGATDDAGGPRLRAGVGLGSFSLAGTF